MSITWGTPSSNSNNGGGQSSIATPTMGTNPTVGDIHLVMVTANATSTVTVTDTLGNTYAPLDTLSETGTGQFLFSFICAVTTGGGSNVVTASFSPAIGAPNISVLPVYGAASSNDGHNMGQDNGNNPTTAFSATNAHQPAVAFGFGFDIQGTSLAVRTPYTAIGTNQWSGNTQGGIWCQQSLSTTGSNSINFTNAGFDRNVGSLIILDQGTTPPPPAQGPLPQLMYVLP